MDKLKKNILNIITQKCEQDLNNDPIQPIGYDIPNLQVELDKLYGIGKIAFRDIEQILETLVKHGDITNVLGSYILTSLDRR